MHTSPWFTFLQSCSVQFSMVPICMMWPALWRWDSTIIPFSTPAFLALRVPHFWRNVQSNKNQRTSASFDDTWQWILPLVVQIMAWGPLSSIFQNHQIQFCGGFHLVHQPWAIVPQSCRRSQWGYTSLWLSCAWWHRRHPAVVLVIGAWVASTGKLG